MKTKQTANVIIIDWGRDGIDGIAFNFRWADLGFAGAAAICRHEHIG